jgi:PadR family transcriptional regulator, regulatory protein PadR
VAKGTTNDRTDVLQGTLDLMVLQTLGALGPLHGYGIARRIEQISGDALMLKEGTVYASLVRLQQARCIRSRWAPSDNNRKAKFYEITPRGRRQLAVETRNWNRVAGAIQRLLKLAIS